MWVRYENRRTLVLLSGPVRLRLKVRRYEREGCARHRVPYRPEAEGAMALAQHKFEVPHVRRPRTAARPGRRDQRLHQPPLVIGQPLARPIVPNQRTILGRPHRRLHDSQTVWNATKTPPDQAATPTQATFANGVSYSFALT